MWDFLEDMLSEPERGERAREIVDRELDDEGEAALRTAYAREYGGHPVRTRGIEVYDLGWGVKIFTEYNDHPVIVGEVDTEEGDLELYTGERKDKMIRFSKSGEQA